MANMSSNPAGEGADSDVGGCWIAFGWDWNPYLIGIYPTEVEALRAAIDNHGEVMFLPYGMNITDAAAKQREAS